MKLKPADFNQHIEFGTTEDNLDKSGNFYDSKFIPTLNLWCAPHNRTLNQQYQIMKTELEDTIVVVIRHNPKVNETYKVKYRGDAYKIVSISADDSNQILTYDLITLRKIEKVGS